MLVIDIELKFATKYRSDYNNLVINIVSNIAVYKKPIFSTLLKLSCKGRFQPG